MDTGNYENGQSGKRSGVDALDPFDTFDGVSIASGILQVR